MTETQTHPVGLVAPFDYPPTGYFFRTRLQRWDFAFWPCLRAAKGVLCARKDIYVWLAKEASQIKLRVTHSLGKLLFAG